MRARLVLALGLASCMGGAAHAQDAAAPAVREARCWLGSSTFSSGAAMDAGGDVMVCDALVGWKLAEGRAAAAGCMLEGDLSSVGAIVGVRNNNAVVLECGADGRWTTLPVPSEN